MSAFLIDKDKLNKYATESWKASKHVKVEDKDNPAVTFEGREFAIIEGKKGAIVTCNECVHEVITTDKVKDYQVSIDFYRHERKDKDSYTFGIIPAFSMRMTLDELKPFLSKKPVKWEKWVHLFGSMKQRMADNYRLLRDSVKTIGATDKLPAWSKDND